MLHIPIACEVLGILATLYVLARLFDAKSKYARMASWQQRRVTLDDPSRRRYSLLASADMKPYRSFFDPAYIRWRAKFVPFEARCFGTLCEFVRVHFEDLLDDYCWEGYESFSDFPAWAFERYLRDPDGRGDDLR